MPRPRLFCPSQKASAHRSGRLDLGMGALLGHIRARQVLEALSLECPDARLDDALLRLDLQPETLGEDAGRLLRPLERRGVEPLERAVRSQ